MEDLTAKPECASAFDAHHAPSNEIIEKCVHCGFCLPVCPTYVLWGQEMDSPRGRIYLMKMASEGAAEMNSTWVSHSIAAWAAGLHDRVPVRSGLRKLIEATRAQIERKTERSPGEKLHRRFMFETFTRPERLRRMRLPLLAYQKSGMQAVGARLGPAEAFAEEGAGDGSASSQARAARSDRGSHASRGPEAPAGWLAAGLRAAGIFPQVNAATARVLAAEGCEVVTPETQPCCGALLVHAGEEAAAVELAKKTIDAFERADVETVVTNAAGCGSNVKEYGHLLRDDPGYADRAKIFAAKCKDISEVLAGLEPRATRHRLKLRVAFHDSCHLQHAQGVRSQPRALLSSIPGLSLRNSRSRHLLRLGGNLQLVQPDAASELGDIGKAGLIAPLMQRGGNGKSRMLCCKCNLHWRAMAEDSRGAQIQLVDASIRGESIRIAAEFNPFLKCYSKGCRFSGRCRATP